MRVTAQSLADKMANTLGPGWKGRWHRDASGFRYSEAYKDNLKFICCTHNEGTQFQKYECWTTKNTFVERGKTLKEAHDRAVKYLTASIKNLTGYLQTLED